MGSEGSYKDLSLSLTKWFKKLLHPSKAQSQAGDT